MRKKREVKPETKLVTNETSPTRYRLKCKNHKQKEFSRLISDKEITFAIGPAGVGKSYVAIARGIELIQNVSNQYDKIMIINPAVEADEKVGFLPGTLREKLDPFVGPSLDIVDKIMGIKTRLKLEEDGVIVVGALGFLRGKTIDNTILLMEEAQNMSPRQMKTLLTRIGSNTKFIISGDLDQSDKYTDYKQSGLYDAMNRHNNIDDFGFIEFSDSEEENVRNPIISRILANYKKTETTPPNLPSPPKDRKVREGNPTLINKKKKKSLRFLRKLRIWFFKNFSW